MSLAAQSLSSLRRQLTAGEISPRDIIEDVVSQISARDGDIGAFISSEPETALTEADKADLSLPLGGLPIGIKDTSMSRDHPAPVVPNSSPVPTLPLMTPPSSKT